MNAIDTQLQKCVPPHGVDAMSLGATMYVPIVHPGINEVVDGSKYPRLRSVVLCLEDALHADDVERGLAALRTLLDRLARQPPRIAGPRLFVRPRGLAMATALADWPGIDAVGGFVVPKLGTEQLVAWWQLAGQANLQLMPTLENAWVFDPVALHAFGAMLDRQDQTRLVALRVGGNDLLATMRLRRTRGRTLYETPLAWGLSQLMCQLGSRGYSLTAPVFDVLDDLETLKRECERDAEFGFVGKTAVHPSQIDIIEQGFAVDEVELGIAHEALADEADAVYQRDGLMLEPATHRAWAQRIVARARVYGVRRPCRG